MAVDGKNTSGRIAAAAALWLLVAIFAIQDNVYCQETKEQYLQRLQQQQQQQQQNLLQPSQLSPSQLSPSQLSSSQLSPSQLSSSPPSSQQQQLQQPLPNQQSGLPKQSELLNTINQNIKDMTPKISGLNGQSMDSNLEINPQQQQQNLPELPNPIVDQNMNDIMTSRISESNEQPMNPGFGTNNPQQQQQELNNNVAGPSNIPDGNRLSTFPGGPPSVSDMQTNNGLPVQPNSDNTNQVINPQYGFNSPSESNPYSSPILQTNQPLDQSQNRPTPVQYTKQTISEVSRPMNNAPGSMSIPQYKYVSLKYPQYFSKKINIPMGFPKAGYQPPLDFNNNMYNPSQQSNTPGFPGQNMKLGNMMQPMETFTKMIPNNPSSVVFNAVDKFGNYGNGVKDGLTRTFRDVVGKVLDQGQAGTQRVLEIGSTGANALFDISRRFLIPDSTNQQPGGFGARFTSSQQNMPQDNGYNSNQFYPPSLYNNYKPPQYTGGVPQYQ